MNKSKNQPILTTLCSWLQLQREDEKGYLFVPRQRKVKSKCSCNRENFHKVYRICDLPGICEYLNLIAHMTPELLQQVVDVCVCVCTYRYTAHIYIPYICSFLIFEFCTTSRCVMKLKESSHFQLIVCILQSDCCIPQQKMSK